MTRRAPSPALVRSTWSIPIALAVLTLAGLVVALTGDGWRDALSCIALAVPIINSLWAIARRS